MSIDYSFWDSLQELTLSQASYLWCDLEPQQQVGHPPKVLAINNRLYEAVERGEVIGGVRDTRGHGGAAFLGNLYLSRYALRHWAEKQGMRPKFLFQEEREKHSQSVQAHNGQESKSSEPGPRKIDNVRKALSLAVYALVDEKAGSTNDFGTLEKPNVSKIANHLNQQVDVLQARGLLQSTQGLSTQNLNKEISAALKLIGLE